MRNWPQHSLFRLALLGVVVALVGAATFGVHYYRHRFVREDRDLVSLLPRADTTTFFVNLAGLRRAGFLNTLFASQRLTEPEYRSFLNQTHFDYERDIDSLAGAAAGGQLFFLVKGRFDWQSLRRYAARHGGNCHGPVCDSPTSKPDRWASFMEIQPNVLALALSGDRTAVLALSPRRDVLREPTPEAPVWVKVSHSVLRDPTQIPLALRIFAITLQSASSVTLSLVPNDSGAAAFNVRLDADYVNEPTAETARSQMELQTKMLKLELSRENHKPDPRDLSGLLLEGTFQVVNKDMVGFWPVHRELLDVLQ